MSFVKALTRSSRARCKRALVEMRLACARLELAHVRRCIELEVDLHIAKTASLAGQAVHVQRQIAVLEERLTAEVAL